MDAALILAIVVALIIVAFILHPIRFVMRIAIFVGGVLLLTDLLKMLNEMTCDCARSFRSPDAAALRRLMLREPHIAPLTDFVEQLRSAHPASEFPYFDPLDGGTMPISCSYTRSLGQ